MKESGGTGRSTTAAAAEAAQWGLVAAGASIAVGGGAIFFILDTAAASIAWEITMSLLLLVMAIGIVWHKARQRRGWLAIWAGLVCAHVGGLLAAHPDLVGIDPSPPSIVDLLRLANYPLGALGVLVLLIRSDRRIGWRATLEAAIAVGAGALVIHVAVIGRLVNLSELDGMGLAVALAYPLMDVLLLGVLVSLLMHLDARPGPLVLVSVALAGNLFADVAFGARNVTGSYAPGGAIDVGWLLCFAALAVAPSWPLGQTPRVVGDDGRLGRARLVLVATSALVVPAILVGQSWGGDDVDTVVAIGSLLLVVLAFARMAVFNRDLDAGRAEIASVADELAVTNCELEAARSDQRALLDRVHRLIEQERVLLAANIHDRPLQNLAGVGYQLERLRMTAERGEMEATAALADQVAGELSGQLTELRDLMTEIRPPVLDEQGLVGALRDAVARIADNHPSLHFDVEGEIARVDADVETALYRVAQEALQNVVKHADAAQVLLSVTANDGWVVLGLRDDGRGFDIDRLPRLVREGHFGIAGMRERIELMGGRMELVSGTHGTMLTFALPANVDAVEQVPA